jgi:RNA polymerase-binding transcription factor DksA
MREVKLKRYRSRLLQLRTRLVSEVTSKAEAIRDDVAEAAAISRFTTHAADHDSDGLDRDVALAATQAGILGAVESSLERMEKGTYGKCSDCGKSIPLKRLDAIPYAAWCVPCAAKHETH